MKFFQRKQKPEHDVATLDDLLSRGFSRFRGREEYLVKFDTEGMIVEGYQMIPPKGHNKCMYVRYL